MVGFTVSRVEVQNQHKVVRIDPSKLKSHTSWADVPSRSCDANNTKCVGDCTRHDKDRVQLPAWPSATTNPTLAVRASSKVAPRPPWLQQSGSQTRSCPQLRCGVSRSYTPISTSKPTASKSSAAPVPAVTRCASIKTQQDTCMPSSSTAALKTGKFPGERKGGDTSTRAIKAAPAPTISPCSGASASTTGRATSAASDPRPTVFQGIVKSSKGAYAWAVCAALQSKFPDQDVFLHRNKCLDDAMPWQSERVSFTLICDEWGRPQAAQFWRAAQPRKTAEQEMIDAKDWYAARFKR